MFHFLMKRRKTFRMLLPVEANQPPAGVPGSHPRPRRQRHHLPSSSALGNSWEVVLVYLLLISIKLTIIRKRDLICFVNICTLRTNEDDGRPTVMTTTTATATTYSESSGWVLGRAKRLVPSPLCLDKIRRIVVCLRFPLHTPPKPA